MAERVLVTGAAGFIGFHTAQALLARGATVVGYDEVNDYYATSLKRDRLKILDGHPDFRFVEADVADAAALNAEFARAPFDRVIHLAAQAGVRYSLENPAAYLRSNVTGFGNVLEACRHHATPHLTYASSSSVYGANVKMPFSERDPVNHPVSLYAATKRANELMAHTYSHLFALPTTGLRFFTVYGPWGRPDMAPMLFANAIAKGEPIRVFNHGKMRRDFTYIEDIVDGVLRASDRIPAPNPEWSAERPDPATSWAPFRVYNIGNHEPVELLRFIEIMETAMGRTTEKIMLDMQPGDVPATYADVDDLSRDAGFAPRTSIETGIGRFVEWFRTYYGV